jgi:HlyD family secretion protein
MQSPAAAAGAGAGAAAQQTATIDKGDVTLTTNATGPLSARQQVNVSFLTQGRVVLLNVQEGDHVRKGQTIAVLDTTDLQDAVNQAQANLDLQQINLRTLTDKPRAADVNLAQANLAVAQAQLTAAKSSGADPIQVQSAQLSVEQAKNSTWQAQLQRDATVKKQNDINNSSAPGSVKQGQLSSLPPDRQLQGQIRSAESDVQISQAQLADQQSRSADLGNIASAQASIQSAQVALDKLLHGGTADQIAIATSQVDTAQKALDLAKHNLAQATLMAPFDGAIGKINLNVGQDTPAGQPALVMIDDSSFYVDVPVDEADESKVTEGQDATLAVDALPGVTVKGKVLRIAKTATANGNTITYTARITIDPQGQPLRSGMSTTATIILATASNVLRVENRFIQLNSRTGEASVQVRQPDGSLKTVSVKLGLRNDMYSEVVSGLKLGDVVVLQPRGQRLFGGPGGGGGGFGG